MLRNRHTQDALAESEGLHVLFLRAGFLEQIHPRERVLDRSNQASVSGPEFSAQPLGQGQVVGVVGGGK